MLCYLTIYYHYYYYLTMCIIRYNVLCNSKVQTTPEQDMNLNCFLHSMLLGTFEAVLVVSVPRSSLHTAHTKAISCPV